MQGSQKNGRLRVGKRVIYIFALCLMVITGHTSSALGAQTHAFDPELSLTGGCTTSAVDPVPDPPSFECEAGVHPPASFSAPRTVTTDFYGDVYVSSYGNASASGAEGRVDIFTPQGLFITDVPDEAGPVILAVDSEGYLYVFERKPGMSRLARFTPTLYNPEAGEIAYEEPPKIIAEDFFTSVSGLAINPSNDHLFVHYGASIHELSSAVEGNDVVDSSIGAEVLGNAGEGISVAVDAAHNLLYASDRRPSPLEGVIRVFELAPPHKLLKTFDGSLTPAGKYGIQPSIAADEGTGHFFVYDGGEAGSHVVYEYTAEGELVSTINYGIKDIGGTVKISIDNGPKSPNGALDPEGRYLFVPSHPVGVGHAFAYGPFNKCPPVVESTSFANVTQAEVELQGVINPCKESTSYVIEYTTEQRYQEEGFTGATVAGEGQIPAEGTEVKAAASVTGLFAETLYRFRIVATNELGSDEGEGEFTTYPATPPSPPCPNDSLRTRLSALLPDCRAYELVTPADTNARSPLGLAHLGAYFATQEASPAGDRVSFQIEGGALPGSEGTGSFGGDPYLSTRSSDGWSTASAGPSGLESVALLPGSVSSDQGYSFWSTGNGEGSAAIAGRETSYVRYPDGHSDLVGRGSIGTDPHALGRFISENGEHVIFTSGSDIYPAVQLETNAPPDGTNAIYDRTPDEVTHVVSLLPGDATPAGGKNAFYEGASRDGRSIAFKLGGNSATGPLYLRYNNVETVEVAAGGTFAGFSETGSRIFYLEGGDLFGFDAESKETIPFSTGGGVSPVNVSADGSTAYFVSPNVLTGEANPNGSNPKAGQENLYRSEEGSLSFVGTVTKEDVWGEETETGLGWWTPSVVSYGEAARDPSRATPDGSILLFESRANLSGYNPEGHTEIYRYDSVGNELSCLSCISTGTPAVGGASLQSIALAKGDPEPLNSFAIVNNLRSDGRRVFFQSTEALVPNDTDGLQDIYEWEAQGVGSCDRPDGCIYLISSGHSARGDYLYAVSDSGDDVFFRSSDLLVPADKDETPSIYDARVGGGFPEFQGDPCQVTQLCPAAAPPAPFFSTPGSRNTGPSGNLPKHCPKGKREVRRHGKVSCVKKHRKHRHRKAGSKKGAGK